MGTYRTIYSGRFLAVNGIVWRVDIESQTSSTLAPGGELTFSDNAVEIEWGEKSKEEVLCGSSATVTVISPTDRTYVNLYTIPPGEIRARIYREVNGQSAVYWVGMLDPEFYEEPYECEYGYEVKLTFTDFGILERTKFDLEGARRLVDIIQSAVACTGLAAFQWVVSTNMLVYGTNTLSNLLTPADLTINTANFTDEDGEVCTLGKALTAVLQPLGLRAIQRYGLMWIYDLNALYTKTSPRKIEWSGDSQTLSVDKVAQLIGITFSPYSDTMIASGEVDPEEVFKSAAPRDWLYWTSTLYSEAAEGFRLRTDRYGNVGSQAVQLFRPVATHPSLALYHGGALFALRPEFSGSACAGVVQLYYGTGSPALGSDGYPTGSFDDTNSTEMGYRARYGYPVKAQRNDWTTNDKSMMFRMTEQPYVFAADESDDDYALCITLPLLADTRYNPFESAGDSNEGGRTEDVKSRANHVFVPVILEVLNERGATLAYYSNAEVSQTENEYRPSAQPGSGASTVRRPARRWITLENPTVSDIPDTAGDEQYRNRFGGAMYLEYYDPNDRKNSSAICNGWVTNRRNIGLNTQGLPDRVTKLGEGEYVPLPPVAGRLRLTVCNGIIIKSHNGWKSSWGDMIPLRWIMFKGPKIELKHSNGTTVDITDVEYKAYANRMAADDMSIETICGSTSNCLPTSRGVYRRADNNAPLEFVSRAGRVSSPERLLLRTLCSQFAERKTKLTGEAVMDTGYQISTYSDANQVEVNSSGTVLPKRFIMVGEVQRLRENVSDITLVELRPDEWEELVEE